MSRDVHSCTHWLRPRNSPPPPHLDSYYEGAIGQQDRRHLFVTTCRWFSLTCEYLQEYRKKFEMNLIFSGAWGKMIHEKTWSKKSWDTDTVTLILEVQRRLLLPCLEFVLLYSYRWITVWYEKGCFFQAEFTIFCPVPGLQFTAVVDKIIDTEILCVYNNFKVRLKTRR